jgi:hypothetical protein
VFNADTKNKQRSGQSLVRGWETTNRHAGAGQHTNSEVVASQLLFGGPPKRLLRQPVGGGWFFGATIELPAAPYPKIGGQRVIHLQSSHALVTTGIRDAAHPTGALVTSRPGLWIALQQVPAQVTVSGNPVWNLPQWPLPTPANYDDATNFWLWLGEQYC